MVYYSLFTPPPLVLLTYNLHIAAACIWLVNLMNNHHLLSHTLRELYVNEGNVMKYFGNSDRYRLNTIGNVRYITDLLIN